MLKHFKRTRGKAFALIMSVSIVFTAFGSIGSVPTYASAGGINPPLAELEIVNVEELTGGETQSLYRDEVYKGNTNLGQDPNKYYTDYRDINLKDPRVFTFEFNVAKEKVGSDPSTFLDKVDLQYGGLDLEEWVWDGYNSMIKPKTTSVLAVKDKAFSMNSDGSYKVRIQMETDTAWGTSKQSDNNNVPYDNYGAGRQFDFSTGQSSDNRGWWQAGPLHRGVDTYTMTATVDGEAVAERDMHIGPYDGVNSWIEINEYAQSLVKAITGQEYPKEKLDGKTTGTVAKGYVGVDEKGNFVTGRASDDVYVEVSILGFGLTDNYKEENKDYNNYAQYNPIWNIAVAKDAKTVDSYLNETVPAMNSNPQKIIDTIKDQKDEDIKLTQVFYQNNVHSDEVTGTDTMIKLTRDLIEGGKSGKDISYKSWDLEDMDLQYRDPAKGAAQGEDGHAVKGGYSDNGIFMQKDTRNDKVFNTKEALDNFIFVNTLCSNPDGKAGMRRTNRYAFDLNRDAVFSTMPETIAVIKDLMKWDPIVMNEWHGYVTQMLIECCTAPHDPAYDYDLLQDNMLNLTYAAGLAATGSTGMQRFLVPWDHYDGGDWDDGGTIYAPMFAMLLGCYGYTIEFPYSNLDSKVAGDVINYAMVDELLHGKTEFFPGNRLNGELEDVNGKVYPSHSEDIKYSSMRKSSLINKLETKARGLTNKDAKETADKYFIDKKKNVETGQMEDKVVGRARPVDEKGNEMSFFPDYIVVPTDEENQYNVAEGMKAINQLIGWNIEVSKSAQDVTYNGKTIPAGAYVLNMKQAKRNVIFEVMGKGYDATGFASMYADIYCNLPDVRGFDSIQVYDNGLFDGKLSKVTSAEKKAEIKGTAADYIAFKSQSTDAVRFVNLLLSGTSSGNSVSDKGDVWMLRKDVKGVGEASDYIIKASDLAKLGNLQDNPVIGLKGCQIEGQYIDKLPEEAVQLVEPVIQLNTTRTSQTGGPLWYMLDDLLGFGSLKDYDGSNELRDKANVIIANNSSKLTDKMVNAVKTGTGIIFIRNANALSQLDSGIAAPSRSSFADIAIEGKFNVDDSIFTSNYAKTDTYYARGYKYSNLPEGAKILFQSDADKDKAFIGGFQNTKGQKDIFANAVTMFSTILGSGDNQAQALVIGQQLDYRPHYQKLLPLLATAIYADAAGILDDENNPVISKQVISGGKIILKAEDADKGVAESGLKMLSVYLVKGDKEQLIEESKSGKITIVPNQDMKIKVVAVDYAGNKTCKTYNIDGVAGTIDDNDKTAAEITTQIIKAIGTVTVESGDAIRSARAAYDALSESEKAEVTNYQTLEIAELKYERLQVSKIDTPIGVTAINDAKTGKIKLSWQAVNGAEEYQVYRATSKDGSYQRAFITTGTNYTNTSAVPGKAYFYKVKAISGSKKIENSNFSATVKRTCDLARPAVAVKSSIKCKIKLTWKKVTNAKKYVIYRATSKNGTFKKIYTTTKLSYTNKNLKSKRTYYYKVKALAATSAANSAYSLLDKCKCQ